MLQKVMLFRVDASFIIWAFSNHYWPGITSYLFLLGTLFITNELLRPLLVLFCECTWLPRGWEVHSAFNLIPSSRYAPHNIAVHLTLENSNFVLKTLSLPSLPESSPRRKATAHPGCSTSSQVINGVFFLAPWLCSTSAATPLVAYLSAAARQEQLCVSRGSWPDRTILELAYDNSAIIRGAIAESQALSPQCHACNQPRQPNRRGRHSFF